MDYNEMNDAEFIRRLAVELRSIGKADVADRLTALADRLQDGVIVPMGYAEQAYADGVALGNKLSADNDDELAKCVLIGWQDFLRGPSDFAVEASEAMLTASEAK